MPGYPCRICGGHHDLPEALSAGLPEPCLRIPPSERDDRIVLGDEMCKLDDRRYFLRGNVELPLPGRAVPFVWTLWVELERVHFKRALALWMRDRRTREPAYPATLASALPHYEPTTEGLDCELISQPVGVRFSARVTADHPLSREQREGADPARARALAESLAHA